ncbi:MAG: hypothetical protein AAGE80_10460 [Pseudomonadota bacterium]
MEYDSDAYIACIQEIKDRLEAIETFISACSERDFVERQELELAALNLRKIYELAVFASLSAHRKRLADEWKKYSKAWRLSQIVSRLERWNSEFLQICIELIKTDDPNADRAIKVRRDLSLTSAEIKKLHGGHNEILHAINPYSKPIHYQDKIKSIVLEKRNVERWLSKHQVCVVPRQAYLLVSMYTTSGQVECALAERLPK